MNTTEFRSCPGPAPFFAINAKTSLLVIVNETNHLDDSFGSCFQGTLLLQMCEVILKEALQDRDSTRHVCCDSDLNQETSAFLEEQYLARELFSLLYCIWHYNSSIILITR